MISLCSSTLLLSLTPLSAMYDSTDSSLFLSPTLFSLLEAFQCSEERMEGWCCECMLMSSFFSTGCKNAFYWELPNCGSFDTFSFFIHGGDNSCEAQCLHYGSWLKYKNIIQYEATSELTALLAVLLHNCFQQEAQYLNACDGKSGNPIEGWFPSASSSLLTLLNPFSTCKTGTYHLHCEREENKFSASWIFHLSSIPSVKVSLMYRYKSLKFPWSYTMIILTLLAIVPICWYKEAHI